MNNDRGYADLRNFKCVSCGEDVMLTKFASAKTARCPKCKGKPASQEVSNTPTSIKSPVKQPVGETKVCKCTKCGVDVTVTKFASASKVICDDCKGESSGGETPVATVLKIDISKLDKTQLPQLDEFYVLPSIIGNKRLREVKCPACGHEHMRIIKINDGSDFGLVISYQCTECKTLIMLSEQCNTLISPQKSSTIMNYRGEIIKNSISTHKDTQIRNTIDRLMTIIESNGLVVDGIEIPEYTRPYQKLIQTGFNTEEPTSIHLKTIDDTVRLLRESARNGNPVDKPEGTRYIKISDTLATEIADRLNSIMTVCKKLKED